MGGVWKRQPFRLKTDSPYVDVACAGLRGVEKVPLHWLAYWVHRGAVEGGHALTAAQWERFLDQKRAQRKEVAHPKDGRTGLDQTWNNHGAGLRLVPLAGNRD